MHHFDAETGVYPISKKSVSCYTIFIGGIANTLPLISNSIALELLQVVSVFIHLHIEPFIRSSPRRFGRNTKFHASTNFVVYALMNNEELKNSHTPHRGKGCSH